MSKRISVLSRLFILHLFIFLSCYGYGQTDQTGWIDDPNFDHIPPSYYQAINNQRSPEVVITLDGWDNFDLGIDYAEPHQSVNPLDPTKFINAWNTNNTHYTQNGFDWSTLAPSFGVSANGDPVTAYDSLGNLYYETMFGGITGCKVIRSTNNGQTWSAAVTAIAGNDKNWIACDQTSGPYANYVYTVMTPGNFARSTNQGASFQTTGTSSTFGSTQTLPGMMVAVGPNGSVSGGCVYVVTHSGSNSAGRYTFFRSTDGGTTFSQRSQQFFSNYIGTEISGRSTVNGMRTRPYPMIAADNSFGPHRGRLYLVYASNLPAGNGNKPDIFLRYSDDQAATWSASVMVNDDPNPATHHSFFPAIWCDKQTGRLFIKFYDSRLCPTSDSMDVYATYTDDGGATFAPNQRISNRTFKTKVSSSGSAPAYQGDYDAIAGINNQSLLVWTDFRNNNYGSYVAYFPDFAMLTSVSSLTVGTAGDMKYFNVSVPAVKLYTNTATFTTEVTPTPASGQILVTPEGSNVLTSYPDSVRFKVKTVGLVPQGSYLITITGKGPNGTPIHKRTVDLNIGPPVPFQLTVNIQNSWNLVSIPGLHPINQNVTTWWSGKDPAANVWQYSSGYYSWVSTVEPGKGYWMKHIGALIYNTGDEWPAGGIILVPHDPIPGMGWTLFGGYEEIVPVSGLTTVPPGLISSPVYGFSGGGYQIVDSLRPGYGYWVRLSGSGSIIIPPGSNNQQGKFLSRRNEIGGTINITDGNGETATLKTLKNETHLNEYDLPPSPPQGMFDIRYSSQRNGENIGSIPKEINMMGVKHPIKIKIEGIGITLFNEWGEELARLRPGDEVILETPTQKLMISEN